MYLDNTTATPSSKEGQLITCQSTLLVVDDDASNIQILLNMLEHDYRILVATSGEQALKLIHQTDHISLVLLDVDMPLLSGFEVLKHLRDNTVYATLPVIMVTAQNHANHEAYALEQGANDFISKPISAPVVKARIKTQLSLYKSTHTITQKNKELELSFDKLQKAKEELSHFMAMVSHELRTPIAILQCETELLNDGIRKPSQENLSSLLEEIKHVSALINDMFDLVLSESKSLSYEKEPCELKMLLTRTIKLFAQQFQENSLTLTSNTEIDSEFWVLVDTKRIRQVIDNLLRNSTKYTEANGKVHITLENQDNHICLRVEDSKPGVEDKNIAQLFDRFYRVEKSRNRAMGGSGLGLSICKTIIEAHDGCISSGPSPYGGLTIKILLPCLSEHKKTSASNDIKSQS
jgi:signal transduction histidine kinase